MRQMLQRVDAMAVAKHAAVIYGVFTAGIAIIMFPFFLIAIMMGDASGPGRAAGAFSLVFIILYPILGLIFGWIFGWVAGAVFNFAAPRIGGVPFETAEEGAQETAAEPATA